MPSSAEAAVGDILVGFEIEYVTPYFSGGFGLRLFNDPIGANSSLLPGVFNGEPLSIVDAIRGIIGPACRKQDISNKKGTTYDTWNVAHDQSVEETIHTDLRGYTGWQSIEIISPILVNFDDNCRDVLSRILSRCRVRLNSTCGLHVHVGLVGVGPDRFNGWRTQPGLLGLKKMATILWMASTRLELLYHPIRKEKNSLMMPMTENAALLKHALRDPTQESADLKKRWLGNLPASITFLQQIRKVWDEDSYQGIEQLLKGTDKLNYRFDIEPVNGKGTVEFRQMEATFDNGLLLHWTETVKKIGAFASSESNQDAFQILLVNLSQDDNKYTIDDFLIDVGCSLETVNFFRAKRARCQAEFESLKRDTGFEAGGFTNENGFMRCLPYKVSPGKTRWNDNLFENPIHEGSGSSHY